LTYEAIFLNTFLKRFRRLADSRERIKRRVQELAQNPHLGVRLRGQLEGFWKDRVGKYCIIYKVEDATRRLIFYDVDLRKKIYDLRPFISAQPLTRGSRIAVSTKNCIDQNLRSFNA